MRNFAIPSLVFVQNENRLLPINWYSSLIPPKSEQNRSFTVAYLVNSCGLSEEAAVLASQSVRFTTPNRANSVLALLKEQGFGKSEIPKVISSFPGLLVVEPAKSILPTIEFFLSKGFSRAEVVKLFSMKQNVLRQNLEKSIIPRFDFLKSVLLDDRRVVTALKLGTKILFVNVEGLQRNVGPNIELLRQYGASEAVVSYFLSRYISELGRDGEVFRKKLNEIIEMGFDPSQLSFVHALAMMVSRSKSDLERRKELYRKWGWSDNELSLAFRKNPICMILSEKKISTTMDFLVNKMGFQAKDIAERASILYYSLEKRIIPRCSVAAVLKLMSLTKKDLSLYTLVIPSEKLFLKNFVTRYSKQAPELMSVYKGEIDFFELGFEPEAIQGVTEL